MLRVELFFFQAEDCIRDIGVTGVQACALPIYYFAPYKYVIGDNWNNNLKKFIPLILRANDTTIYYKSLSLLAASLNDGHAQARKSVVQGKSVDLGGRRIINNKKLCWLNTSHFI